jgi:N-acetylneuraminic acid mutarotase
MSDDLSRILRRAAAVPSEPLDLGRLLARGRRRRRRRQVGAVLVSLVLVGAAGSAVHAVSAPGGEQTVPDAARTAASARTPPGGRPSTGAPDHSEPPTPVRFAELPTGWTDLAAPPEVRSDAAVAWTGEQLLMWGGRVPNLSTGVESLESDGFAFDAETGVWQPMTRSPLAGRGKAASAWTGTELLVWGGMGSGIRGSGIKRYDDGAAYDPRRRTWRPLPPAPISARAPFSVWTGEELIVWGTAVRDIPILRDGAAYNPATDSWRTIADGPVALTDATAVWTGDEMIVFGAALSQLDNSPQTPTAVGAGYDPATDTWRRLPDSDLSPQATTAAWDGEELIAWDYQVAAAAYDPERDRWRALPDVPLRPMECFPNSVAAGEDVFGDYCGSMVVFSAPLGRWHDITDERFGVQSGGFTLVPVGRVVVLLGWSADDPAMLAYQLGP